ncbi:uncharacterized protein JN550_004962 [Neoarthrinium moseri]|uniref:uncharacterized protein n=1 Tax=Neoarthrinium moseri TaxID=1658444 RepID=UPI001FDCDEBF|nr:uncharacterized protein JN550_004962 [Neoarthrinium moseri]KAI1870816.1 hypothetical protein JN550_004962 [Neoarthrinium moseri]
MASAKDPASSAASRPTRETRQTRSTAAVEGETPHGDGEEKPEGKLQQSTFPRRFAPERTRGQSVESFDFPESSQNVPDGGSSPPSPQERGLSAVPEPEDEDEAEAVSWQDILEIVIPSIENYSARLYDHLQKEAAPSRDRSWWNRLRFLENLFKEQHNRLGPAKPFIDPSDIIGSFPGIDHEEEFDNASQAMLSTNLILLAMYAAQIGDRKTQAEPVLEELNESFPMLFAMPQAPYENNDLYDMAFRIRCCLLTEQIRQPQSSQSPAILAVQSFCSDEPPRLVKQARDMLLNGPYEPVGAVPVNQDDDVSEEHSRRMQDLCDRLSQRERGEILKILEEAYPMGELLTELGTWALKTYKALKQQPKIEKGKAPARSAQDAQPPRDPPEPAPLEPTKGPARKTSTAEQRRDRSAVDEEESLFVADDDAGMSEHDDESDFEPDEPIVRTGARTGSYLDGSANIERDDRVARRRSRATPPSNQQQVRNPLAALNAEDVVNSSREQASSNPFRSPAAAKSGSGLPDGRKRPLEADEEEDGDEDEYETNTRPLDESRRIVKERPITGPSSSKRVRISDTRATGDGRRSASLANSSREFDRDRTENVRASDISLLSTQARAAARHARQPSAPQRRVFWSDDDTATLIDAIRKYGCQWSFLEEQALFSTFRSQQAIRDKARNLKVDLLKTDVPLLAGFDAVALGKKERDAVKKAGKNPDRMEQDIDDDGNVVNNQWFPEMEYNQAHRQEDED